jgi:hypothetical protein
MCHSLLTPLELQSHSAETEDVIRAIHLSSQAAMAMPPYPPSNHSMKQKWQNGKKSSSFSSQD